LREVRPANLPEFDEVRELRLIVEGDEKAFSRLVDYYWNRVYSHALAYVKSSQRAQEITQDVFLRVWHKKEVLTEVIDFNNYLFVLGKNQIISAMRKKLISPTSADPIEAAEELLVPDKQLEYKQIYHELMEAIDKLPPTRKMVFKLSRLEGLTYDEIATQLSISKNTVKEHIVLALSFLRTHLHKHNELLILLSTGSIACLSNS
jgi:RNA polymerase sigma-70 factor (ECF subfamily)